jgi:hypothetical protein
LLIILRMKQQQRIPDSCWAGFRRSS